MWRLKSIKKEIKKQEAETEERDERKRQARLLNKDKPKRLAKAKYPCRKKKFGCVCEAEWTSVLVHYDFRNLSAKCRLNT